MSDVAGELYRSLDLVLLLVAILANFFLAIVVFRSAPRSATNIIFVLLTLTTTAWLTITHIVRIPVFFDDSLTLHRLGIFFAAPMSALFFLLAHTFPSPRVLVSPWMLRGVIAATFLMMAANISPYAFMDVVAAGQTSQPVPGPGLLPFSVISTLFCAVAVYLLVNKYRHAVGTVRKQVGVVLLGMLTMLVLIIATILVPVVVSGSLIFLPFTPLYALAFLGATAYAIAKYELFSVKVLVTQALTVTIWVVLFARLFSAQSLETLAVDVFVFLFTLIFGFFLMRSVKREVAQRILIEEQRKELQVVNEQQENLLHFISHEIKGYLTEGQNAFASVVEGDYGEAPPKIKQLSAVALSKMREGVATVMSILDASNLKKGTVSYKKEQFDFKAAVEESIAKMRPRADEKGLTIEYVVDSKATYSCTGDRDKIGEHVVRNLIDNAIRYTPKGGIRVLLTHPTAVIRLAVKDTGIGINDEDKQRLFTEGGHGKDSIKVNVDSTGYGLFIAKQVVEAHKGRIWAESAGVGKGSEFVVELPISP